MSYLAYAAFAALGVAAGAIYFFLLYRTVQLHAAGAAVARVAPLYLLRVAGAVAVFWAVAQQGALPLILSLGGFVLAREAVRRIVER